VNRRSGRLWYLKAFGVFLICLVGWFAMVIWTGTAFGANLSLPTELRSHLLANYGIDVSGQSMRYLSLTILGEVFSDQGLSDESFFVVDALLQDPVPTATPDGGPEEITPTKTQLPTETRDLTSTAEAQETVDASRTPGATETSTQTPTETATATYTATATHTYTPTPTKTQKPTKTPTPTDEIDDVYPLLLCVNYLGGGENDAYFGYYNPSSHVQDIPIGERNRFDPLPKDRGQPINFLPGEHNTYPGDVFKVTFTGYQLTWHLTSHSVTAYEGTHNCEGILEPTATPTYETPADTSPPFVGTGYLNPEPGPLTGCRIQIHVDNLLVEDDPYSSGINWVKLKYVVEVYTSDLYSDPLTMVTGGFNGDGGWEGYFSGSVFIEIDREWTSPAPDDFYVKVWGKAKDNAGYESYSTLGSYTMPASCGKTPE
jgi:hypothetical protein